MAHRWTEHSPDFEMPPAGAEPTEDAVARDFERANDGKFLFNATRGQWLSWNGVIWEPGNLHIRDCEGWGWQHPHLLGHGSRLVGTAEAPQKVEGIAAAQKVFGLVPQNETAPAVAFGNDPSASSVETWESEG
jgi:hypothetical protein